MLDHTCLERSQAQLAMAPLLQARVRACTTPALLMAYTKADSRVPATHTNHGARAGREGGNREEEGRRRGGWKEGREKERNRNRK